MICNIFIIASIWAWGGRGLLISRRYDLKARIILLTVWNYSLVCWLTSFISTWMSSWSTDKRNELIVGLRKTYQDECWLWNRNSKWALVVHNQIWVEGIMGTKLTFNKTKYKNFLNKFILSLKLNKRLKWARLLLIADNCVSPDECNQAVSIQNYFKISFNSQYSPEINFKRSSSTSWNEKLNACGLSEISFSHCFL